MIVLLNMPHSSCEAPLLRVLVALLKECAPGIRLRVAQTTRVLLHRLLKSSAYLLQKESI